MTGRSRWGLVALGSACCNPGGDDGLEPGPLHSCDWPADAYCHEYNNRSETLGIDVAAAAALCSAEATFYSPDGTTEFRAEGCDQAASGDAPIVGRCVLPEEGESLDGQDRAGQPAVLIRYYYVGFDGSDFEPNPAGVIPALVALRSSCQVADQGVWQEPPFVDWDWTVAPRLVSEEHTCTPDPSGSDGDLWDYKFTAEGLDVAGTGVIAIRQDTGGPASETHTLTGDGTTLSVHLVGASVLTRDPTTNEVLTTDQQQGVNTLFPCDAEPHLVWTGSLLREGATTSPECVMWAGSATSPSDLLPQCRAL